MISRSNYTESLIEKLEAERVGYKNPGFAVELSPHQRGINCGLDKAIKTIRNHPAPDVERVRIAILEAMNINYTTYSYRYVAEAAIAAIMGDANGK